MKFTEKDIQQIEARGLSVKKLKAQIHLFKAGLPSINLNRAATLGDGILQLNDAEKERYSLLFENRKDEVSIVKFVPASGVATRMFKFLFQFLKDYNVEEETINAYGNRQKTNELSVFLVGLEKFPFFEEVIHKTHEKVPNFNALSYDRQRLEVVKTMLDQDRLNYSFSPKGLLPFHRYKEHVATAFEEHLFEAAKYASSNGEANLHFTISEIYKHKFDEEFKHIEEVEELTNTAFNVSFSYQQQATDTIAVTPENQPFRESNGSLVFRPSGHGALLENLNAIDADVVFIKNVDNVVVSHYAQEIAFYKKMLAGILLEIQRQAFLYLERLDQGDLATEEIFKIAQFLSSQMNGYISEEFERYSMAYQMAYLREKLNRPIRVCGMVKNEGEPGGGPFWVKDESGTISLQIVESAQIDKKDKNQKDILKSATHFNPVDLVCGIKDYKGRKFDLSKYVDPKTAFITMKTKTGKDLKALELPGLWNGSMAYWNTIFVEVPLVTFNPVKTVNDLLKAPHQYL